MFCGYAGFSMDRNGFSMVTLRHMATKTKKRTRNAGGRYIAAKGAIVKASAPQSEPVRRKNKDGRVVVDATFTAISQLQRSQFTSFAGILRQSDISIREDRSLALQMRRDPDIMSPLNQRSNSVAQLAWEILPEDETEQIQVDQAEELEGNFRDNLRKPLEFFKSLLNAVWYGPAVNQLIPVWNGKFYVPGPWMPIHSDTLAFTEFGNLAIYVGLTFEGEKIQGPIGFVHKLERGAREQMILHVHGREGPDYETPVEADFAYRGRGLRDVLWYQWFMKQTALQFWMTWIERFGLGIRIGTYPDGNPQAKIEMEQIMDNLMGDVSVTIPRIEGQEDIYSISVLEVKATQARVFADLIEGYLAGQIKEMIIGQTATTESTQTGLGSSVADQHAKTYKEIIKGDAMNLADTLTIELVHRYHRYNYGDTPYKPRFSFSVEKTDPKEFITSAIGFVNIGGHISERQAREVLGFTQPEEGEAVLSLENIRAMAGQFGGDDLVGSLFSGMGETPNAASATKRLQQFSKQLAKRYASVSVG